MTVRRRIGLAAGLLAAAAVIWFLALPPSLYRDWTPEHARHPRVVIDGDLVTIDNVRNFRFSPDAPPTGSWETRTYDLRRVDSLWYGLSVFNPDGWLFGKNTDYMLFGFGVSIQLLAVWLVLEGLLMWKKARAQGLTGEAVDEPEADAETGRAEDRDILET